MNSPDATNLSKNIEETVDYLKKSEASGRLLTVMLRRSSVVTVDIVGVELWERRPGVWPDVDGVADPGVLDGLGL